jgi:hypothetical protein
MAIHEFDLTPQPVRASATGKQPLASALSVSGYKNGEAYLFVPAFEGTPALTLTVRVIGGWQTDSEDGWLVINTFTSVTASSGTAIHISLGFLPPYIRWEVSAIGGVGALAAFTITGTLSDT